DAGRLALSAPQGRLSLDGQLRAAASSAAVMPASLSLDSQQAVDLGALATAINNAGTRAFERQIAVRNRMGAQSLPGGARLAAQQIELSSDAGSLTVAGDIVGLKSGAGGGQIQLNADGDLVIASGARLSTAGNGGSSDRHP
uniref:hypothetical protein n=1 Tax=Escherichia coli TaxID=562 RepID=UPI0013797F95